VVKFERVCSLIASELESGGRELGTRDERIGLGELLRTESLEIQSHFIPIVLFRFVSFRFRLLVVEIAKQYRLRAGFNHWIALPFLWKARGFDLS